MTWHVIVLFSVGHVNSMELFIAQLSLEQQAPFQSQRSKESAVWLFFLSPGAHSAAPGEPSTASQSAAGLGGKGRVRGVRALTFCAGTTARSLSPPKSQRLLT